MPANYSKPPFALAWLGFYSWASRTVSGGMIVPTFGRFNVQTLGDLSSHFPARATRTRRNLLRMCHARSAFALFEAVALCEMEHGVAQEPICFGLITASIGFEPIDDVGIQAHGDWLFYRPI